MPEKDIVDVHVTSSSNVVDCFSQYPLLDGDKKYTCEITEFVCPLAGQDPLPKDSIVPPFFTIRRKRLTADLVAPLHDDSSLTTLYDPLGDPQRNDPNHVYVPGKIRDSDVVFQKNSKRPMETPGDLAYHLQRFFNDLIAKYIPDDPDALETARLAFVLNQSDATRDAYLALGPFFASAHGHTLVVNVLGEDDEKDPKIDATTRFVNVVLQPNGVLQLYFAPLFTKYFWLDVTDYGHMVLGIGVPNATAPGATICFRDDNDVVVTGLNAIRFPSNGEIPGCDFLKTHFRCVRSGVNSLQSQ